MVKLPFHITRLESVRGSEGQHHVWPARISCRHRLVERCEPLGSESHVPFDNIMLRQLHLNTVINYGMSPTLHLCFQC